MKKLSISIACLLSTALFLTACGTSTTGSNTRIPTQSPTVTQAPKITPTHTPTPTKESTGNYLKDSGYKISPVMNGSETEVLGTMGYITVDKERFKKVTSKEYFDFVTDNVANAKIAKNLWFTIKFGDGTGVVYVGCNTEIGEYGKIDSNGALTETIANIITSEKVNLAKVIK